MKISQREARRLRKRVDELLREKEALVSRYAVEYPGLCIARVTLVDENHVPTAIKTARNLGHPVCCAVDGQTIKFYALRESQ